MSQEAEVESKLYHYLFNVLEKRGFTIEGVRFDEPKRAPRIKARASLSSSPPTHECGKRPRPPKRPPRPPGRGP